MAQLKTETEMDKFTANNKEILRLIEEWEPRLLALSEEVITWAFPEPSLFIFLHRAMAR